jgi:predicted nucleic acid-binding protein
MVLVVREEAARLLNRHPLRAADALQLAAAEVAFDKMSVRRGFVTLDDDLFTAADAEGFEAIRPAS